MTYVLHYNIEVLILCLLPFGSSLLIGEGIDNVEQQTHYWGLKVFKQLFAYTFKTLFCLYLQIKL